MNSSRAASGRPYGGLSVDERRAQRRAALIEAAIAVYGRVGYRNASVKAVCEEARLTERYFYESFEGSDALLAAAYRAVAGRTREHVLAAGRTAGPPGSPAAMRAMLRTYFDLLRAEPRAARVFLVEIGGVGPAVDQAVREAMEAWMALLTPALAARPGGAPAELLAAGIYGGVAQIAVEWIASGYRRPVAEAVEAAMAICALGAEA